MAQDHIFSEELRQVSKDIHYKCNWKKMKVWLKYSRFMIFPLKWDIKSAS
jgi:hypothetical protein